MGELPAVARNQFQVNNLYRKSCLHDRPFLVGSYNNVHWITLWSVNPAYGLRSLIGSVFGGAFDRRDPIILVGRVKYSNE